VTNGEDGKDGEGDTLEILLPSSAVAAVGVEFNVYWADIFRSKRSLDNYAFYGELSDSTVKRQSLHECFRLTATTAGQYTLTIKALDLLTGETVLSKTLTLYVVEPTLTGVKGLVLGDSLGASDGALYSATIQHELSNGGIEFIGTQTGGGDGLGDTRHECYNGAAIKGFLEQENIVSGYANPFYNAEAAGFDLDYYMNQNGYTQLDFIMLNLGHNQLGNYNTVNQFTSLIAKIRASTYGATIPIFIPLITTVGAQDSWRRAQTVDHETYGIAVVMRNHWWRHNLNNIEAFDSGAINGVYLTTPYWACDPERMFKTQTVARSARDAEEVTRQLDSMHPKEFALKQIADALYPYIAKYVASKDATYYSVTNNLTNVTNSNYDDRVKEGNPYSATLTANSGYALGEVAVTMGTDPVTVTGGVINIASVTGHIVITATATADTTTPSYTNLADPSKATSSPNTSINADEWLNGYYISSKTISAKADIIVTNKIPMTASDTIRIKGIADEGTINGSGCKSRFRVLPCSSDGTALIGEIYPALDQATQTTGYWDYMNADELANGVYCFCPKNTKYENYWANVAFVRICGYPIDGDNSNVIVTVNDPIT
jgi:hypothetical protein